MTFWGNLYCQSQAANVDKKALVATRLHHDLSQLVVVDVKEADWVASPAKGVLRLLLERDGGEQTTRATSVVAYQPNSQFESHRHPRGEEFVVLSGTFSDEHGDYPVATYVRNPPGSSHRPFSRDGCLILVKLQQFDMSDGQHVVKHLSLGKHSNGLVDGWCRQALFEGYENVYFARSDESRAIPAAWLQLGVEMLVMSGGLTMCDVADEAAGEIYCGEGTWLRLPAHSDQCFTADILADKDTQLWIKIGHLPDISLLCKDSE
jgi:hypothetical protein